MAWIPRLLRDPLELNLSYVGKHCFLYLFHLSCYFNFLFSTLMFHVMSNLHFFLPTGSQPNLELKLSDFGTESEECFLGLTLAVKPSVPNLGNFFFLG